MTAQVPTIDQAIAAQDPKAGRHPYVHETFLASLHPNLITLATTSAADNYFVRLAGDQVEALGPIPNALCFDEDHRRLPTITTPGLSWQPCPEELAQDLYPYGAWYIAQNGPGADCYVQSTAGYTKALTAFLASAEAEAFLAQPRAIGRVPCLVLFANGSYATAPDAAAAPIVLPLSRHLTSDLAEQLQDRLWPEGLL